MHHHLKPEQPQTLLPEPKQPQTPFAEPTMTMNKGSMTGRELQLQSLEPIVYSRWKNTQKVEHLTDLLQNHESELISGAQTSNLHVTSRGDDLNVPMALRKGTWSCTQHPISKFVACSHLSSFVQVLVTNLTIVEVPKTIQEALSIPEWRNTVREEMLALEKNRTWDVVEMSEEKSPIGYKWVFTIKYKSDRSIERYKARLVAKSFSQTYGVDY